VIDVDVDVRLARGDFRLACAFRSESGALALFGRSGSGKSTVLGLIAGLLRPDAGHVRIDGETLVDVERGLFVPPHRRRIGMVFQDALLFPHLNVRANLGYGQRFAGTGRPVDAEAVIAMLGIGHLMARRPAGLSGGERQRVAIGRALLAGPRLLLLDEPLSALDFERRREVMPYVERLRDALHCPLVYVSHAVDEVARIAREVVVLEEGVLVASGAPADVLTPGGASAWFGERATAYAPRVR
jgi:molybdate transport system ATP-binding protein